MAIPDYQSVMLPLLRLAEDGQEHSAREAVEKLADHFGLSEDERKELLPSGAQATFDNRVGWARTYMKKAELLESPRRGYFKITHRGMQILKQNPDTINNKLLEQYPEYRAFRARSGTKRITSAAAESEVPEQTPLEVIEDAYDTIRTQLAGELLEQIMRSSPQFFERLVVDLLVRMGYGGSRRDAGEAVGRRSSDEGIDGIIKEDRLGLEAIYLQAKRWKDTVGRPEIQRFVGALHGQNARKGVFITTSSFSKEASQYVDALVDKVVLVDGEALTHLMIEHGVGVSLDRAYEVKRLDSDYFNEV
jgi:restriction system protein